MSRIIDRQTLVERQQSNPALTLVEALPRKYYDDWHLPGAVHLPHDEVREKAATVLPKRDAEIVVYCASDSCRNSHIAADVLSLLGYTDVSVYAGGKADWQEAGLPREGRSAAA